MAMSTKLTTLLMHLLPVAALLATALSTSIMPLGDSISLGCGDAATLDPATGGCDLAFNCSVHPLGPDRHSPIQVPNTCPAWDHARTCHRGYRTRLFSLLSQAGHAVSLVGPIKTGPLTEPDAAVSHAAFPGATIGEVAGSWGSANLWELWTATSPPPDLVLSLLGTNDMWVSFWQPSVTDAGPILATYASLLQNLTTLWPHTHVIVGSIPAMPTQILMAEQLGGNPAARALYEGFNAGLPPLVASLQAEGRAVSFADVGRTSGLCPLPTPTPEWPYGGASGLCCVNDAVHPTGPGYDLLAARWFDAVAPLLTPARAAAAPPAFAPRATPAAFFVDANSGSDTNDGSTPALAFKTLKKMNSVLYTGLQGAATISLAGVFTEGLFMELDKACGSTDGVLRITSTNPAQPAVLKPVSLDAISIYTFQAPACGLNIAIDSLVLVGDGTLAKNETVFGINLYHDAPGSISGFSVSNIDASGFSGGGLSIMRFNSSGATGWIQNVTVQNSAFHDNPGVPSATFGRSCGFGATISGVQGGSVSNCTFAKNGKLFDKQGGGPSGLAVADADGIQVTGCTATDNLSQKSGGSGFDLDGGVTNSVVANCVASGNYANGFQLASYADYPGIDLNNNGWNENNTIRDCTSTGDGYGDSWSAIGVLPFDQPVTNYLISNVSVTLPAKCTAWGQSWGYYGFYIEPQNAWPGTDEPLTGSIVNCPISCTGLTTTLTLACDSTGNPECK